MDFIDITMIQKYIWFSYLVCGMLFQITYQEKEVFIFEYLDFTKN